MDITFKCPNCEQELEVDSGGAGSEIECPACSAKIIVPEPEPALVAAAAEGEARPPSAPIPTEPSKMEKHFAVPVHTAATEALIKKPTAKTLDLIAKEGDKLLRIRTFRRTDCMEVGKDHFDEKVSCFLQQVGQANVVSVNAVNYSYMEMSSRALLTDYGVMIVFKG